jgi:hypothetical protein
VHPTGQSGIFYASTFLLGLLISTVKIVGAMLPPVRVFSVALLHPPNLRAFQRTQPIHRHRPCCPMLETHHEQYLMSDIEERMELLWDYVRMT